RNLQLAKATISIALPPHCCAQQRPLILGFALAAPFNAGDVTLGLGSIVSTACARLVYQFHEKTTAARRSTFTRIVTKTVEARGACEAVRNSCGNTGRNNLSKGRRNDRGLGFVSCHRRERERRKDRDQ